jgi:serine/threonine-protein kinase
LPDRRPYFTMKLVEGRTLADLLRQRADPAENLPRFLTIFEQVCQTLAYAHSNGVIHRDLKPGNVMVGAFGEVQVMDWGLAKALARTEEEGDPPSSLIPHPSSLPETQPGAVLGTYAYMAPEQARGEVERLDERCDVFGLGAILCEILTGRPPFRGASGSELADRARRCDHAEALAALESGAVEADLARLVRACLAAEPSARPANAGAVAAALAAHLAGVQERLRRAELERAAAEARVVAERRRRWAQLAAAAAVLLLVVVGGGWAWYVHQERQQREFQAAQKQRDADATVAPSLTEAGRLFGGAKTAEKVGDLAKFDEALAAAQKADDLARASGASEDVQRRAAALVAELAGEARAAQRDRRLLTAILEVRGTGVEPKVHRDDSGSVIMMSADWQFRAAFLEWDPSFDVDALPTEAAAARLRGRPRVVLTEVIAALDRWTAERRQDEALRRKRPAAWEDGWRRVASLAAALDDGGAERRELRALYTGGGLEQERGLAALSVALRPVPVPFEAGPREGRDRLRQLADKVNVKEEPVLGLLTLAQALRVAGEESLAERLLRQGVRERPQEVALYVGLGQLLEGQPSPRWRDVQECYRVARALRPELGESLAHALVRGGQVQEGLALYDQLIAAAPDNPWLHFRHGWALCGQDRNGAGTAAFREAIRLRPNFAEAYNNLACALNNLGRHDEAEAACEKALHYMPDCGRAYNNLGIALADQGRYPEAEAAYQRAIALEPDAPLCYYNRGVTLADQGRYPEAEAALREAIRLQPDHQVAHNSLGIVLYRQGRSREAEAAYREAIRLQPDHHVAHYNLGTLLVERRRLKEAEAAYAEAIRLRPNLAEAHGNLGILLYDQGRFPGAEAAFREVTRLKPDFLPAHNNLGFALREQGRFVEALKELRQGHALAEAVSECERLIELDRKLPAVLSGQVEPANADECLGFAWLCQHYKHRFVTAARLWAGAFAADPNLLVTDPRQPRRYNAACSAALAAAGQGEDAGNLPDKVRLMLQRQARGWSRADLALWARMAERDEAPAKQLVRQAMQYWQQSADLAVVRDRGPLDTLPEDERRQWRQLWDDAAALLAQVGAPK